MSSVRKKSVSSQPRARRPSEKESSHSSSSGSLNPPSGGGMQRSISVAAVPSAGSSPGSFLSDSRSRKLSLGNPGGAPVRLLHSNSVPHAHPTHSRLERLDSNPTPAKVLRLDPTILFSPGVPESHEFLSDLGGPSSGNNPGTHRPARIKKLTPKGVEYHQTISHKNTPDGNFRIPTSPLDNTINGGSSSLESILSPSSPCPNPQSPLMSQPFGPERPQDRTTFAQACGSDLQKSMSSRQEHLDNGNNGELATLLKTVPGSFNCVNLTPAGPTHD